MEGASVDCKGKGGSKEKRVCIRKSARVEGGATCLDHSFSQCSSVLLRFFFGDPRLCNYMSLELLRSVCRYS